MYVCRYAGWVQAYAVVYITYISLYIHSLYVHIAHICICIELGSEPAYSAYISYIVLYNVIVLHVETSWLDSLYVGRYVHM